MSHITNFTAGKEFITRYSILIHATKLKINIEVPSVHEDGMMASKAEEWSPIFLTPLLDWLHNYCCQCCYLHLFHHLIKSLYYVSGWHQVIDCLTNVDFSKTCESSELQDHLRERVESVGRRRRLAASSARSATWFYLMEISSWMSVCLLRWLYTCLQYVNFTLAIIYWSIGWNFLIVWEGIKHPCTSPVHGFEVSAWCHHIS